MPIPSEAELRARFSTVKRVLLVVSGKGGVGKSTLCCQLAMLLNIKHNLRVGVLDVDLCGPSVPHLLGVSHKEIIQSPIGWLPVAVRPRLSCMSIGFLLKSDADAVVWRGPRKDAMLLQFLSEVNWAADVDAPSEAGPRLASDLDILLIDTPPGTSDEHLTIMSTLMSISDVVPTAALVVTTAQTVATDAVVKEMGLLRRLNVPCIGIVENMSTFVCPSCKFRQPLFGTNGGKKLAAAFGVPLLARMPTDPRFGVACIQGAAIEATDESMPEVMSLVNAIAFPQVAVVPCEMKVAVEDDHPQETAIT